MAYLQDKHNYTINKSWNEAIKSYHLHKEVVTVSRRKSDDSFEILWDFFMATPWWVCLVVAGTAYIILTYILPPMFSTQPLLKGLSSVSRSLAPLAVIVILFVGFCANLRKWTRGLMLDRQTGSDTISKLSWCEFEELIAAAYRR